MAKAPLTSRERRFGQAVGAQLAEERHSEGCSGGDLAARSGVSLDAIRSIESGRIASPGFLVVARLARALGLSLDDLAARGLHAVSSDTTSPRGNA